jgi:(p)ppGpp synthase/HD superfamily hydrolase
MNPTIEFTENLVREKFTSHYDRREEPMIEHIERVVGYLNGEDEITLHIAWMHDLVEDTNVDLGYLKALSYSKEVLEGVDLLTHVRKTHNYAEYIDRITTSGNLRAIKVKLADQMDNTHPKRQLGLNRHVAHALRKKYAGVQTKLMEAALCLNAGISTGVQSNRGY